MSASLFEREDLRGQQIGSDAFLFKPIEIEKLLALIAQLLEIEWLYNEHTIVVPALDMELLPPPEHELEVLYELALFGNMPKIQQRASYLAELSPLYVPFANKIRHLAQEFEDEQLLILIQQFREKTEFNQISEDWQPD